MTAYQRRRIADNTLEQRVTAVETAIEHIETGQTEIKTTINAGFADLHDRIDDQNSNNKPNIVAWAGWAAVFVIILGMFGSGYVRDLNRIETETAQQDLRVRKQTVLSSEYNERLNTLEREIFPMKVIVHERK